MPRILCIARREYLASVKTKGFIIGLVLGPVLMCGGLIAVAALKDQVDVTDKHIAIVDRSRRLASAIVDAAKKRNAEEVNHPKTGKKIRPAYLTEVVDAPTGDPLALQVQLSDRIRRGALHAFVEIGADILHPGTNKESGRVAYFAKGAALDDIRRWLERPINNELRRLRLAEAGLDDTQVKDLFLWTGVDGMGLVSADPQTGAARGAKKSSELEAVGIPMITTLLMWMMIMMGAMPLLNAVMEEKTQRIAEVLLGCATPFELMLGKLLGGVGVALTGATVYLLGGAFALTQLGMFGYFPIGLLPWFFAYVILAICMVGATSAALGSACNDAKDAQNLALPAMLPVLLPMFVLGPVLKEPGSTFAIWASLVPPFTPVLMLLRQSLPTGVPAWQPWVGLIGVVGFTLLLVFVASRIFRVGLMMQGKAPRLSEILRWALRG